MGLFAKHSGGTRYTPVSQRTQQLTAKPPKHAFMKELAITLFAAALIGLATLGRKYLIAWNDGRRIHNWLRATTQDKPGESHRTQVEIARALRLSAARVSTACRQNTRLLTADDLSVSIWRQQRQSVYETRGIISF